MKELEHSWEEDIRQQVEQHEFDFNPEAWAQMEQLLDQAASSSAEDPQAPSGNGGFPPIWKPGLLLLLSIAAIALWWWYRQPEPESVELGGFTWSVAPEETAIAPSVIAPTLPDSLKTEPATRYRKTKSQIKEKTDLRVSKPNEMLVVPESIVVTPKKEAMPILIPLPTRQEIPLLERPPHVEVKIDLPEPLRRKRDRRRLFPDVIEKN